jgi:hypothetical protein
MLRENVLSNALLIFYSSLREKVCTSMEKRYEAQEKHVEHWNGSAWSVVASPNPSSDDVLTAITRIPGTQDDYWAVGQYFSGSSWHTLILHGEDGKWSQISSPDFGTNFNFLTGVTAVSENDAWAVGSYYGGSNGDWFNGVARIPHTNKLWGVGVGNGTLTEAAC